ncbi:putative basic helix-loop-helix leucine zipper transcription factor [Helianthus debilis subsp. tardiflorus]
MKSSSAIELNKLNGKRMKVADLKDESGGGGSKMDQEMSSGSGSKAPVGQAQKASELPKDYIHVRARRGEATDRHSLAERVMFFHFKDLVVVSGGQRRWFYFQGI